MMNSLFRFLFTLCLILFLTSCSIKYQPTPTPLTSATVSNTHQQTTSNPVTESETPINSPTDTNSLPYVAFPFEFAADDLYGDTITEEALGEKRLFFVHYWATWCGPCVSEMPDLADVVRAYEDDVGFIALIDDYSSNPSGAKNIIDSANIPTSFIMVDAQIPELQSLLAMLQTGYIPTTIIIDGNGDMLTEPLIGAYGELYADELELLLN